MEQKMLFNVTSIERNVLAAVLQSSNLHKVAVVKGLDSSTFVTKYNSAIFSAIANIRNSRLNPTPVSVLEYIKENYTEQEVLDNVDTRYINALFKMQINSENFHKEVQDLREYAIHNRMKDRVSELIEEFQKVKASGQITDELTMQFKELIDKAYNDAKKEMYKVQDRALSGKALVDQFWAESEEADAIFFKGGWKKFTDDIGGIAIHNLVGLLGRTGHGKSLVAQDWFIDVTIGQGIKGLYLDTEMKTRRFMLRAVSMISGIPFSVCKQVKKKSDVNKLKPEFRKLFVDTMNAIEKNPAFNYQYVLGHTIEEIHQSIQQAVANGARFIVYDYIGATKKDLGNRGAAEWEILADFAYNLKRIANEYDIVLVIPTQLNREGAKKFSDGGMDNIAGGFGVTFWLDMMVKISKTNGKKDLILDGPYKENALTNSRIEILKDRDGDGEGKKWSLYRHPRIMKSKVLMETPVPVDAQKEYHYTKDVAVMDATNYFEDDNEVVEYGEGGAKIEESPF